MYRTSSEYQFATASRSSLYGVSANVKPHLRRSSINDLIDKFEVPNTTKHQQHNYLLRQMSGNSEIYYDSAGVFYDDGHIEEVIPSQQQQQQHARQGRAARALLPLWCFIKPVLETVAIAPLPMFFSLTGTGIFALIATFLMPRSFSQLLLYPSFRLLFGTLYPAYASYKAVKTKNVKEYVKWMMYWIVFAFFTCIETFTDIFLSWFPFYYEIKVILVIWLLSPATKGSSTLYRKFVHPMLTRREQEIDEYISQAKEKGYTAVLQLGSKGVNYATNVIMQTAIKGGGGLVQSIRRSYSLSDLSEPDDSPRSRDDIDVVMRPQRILRTKNTRSMPVGRGNVDMSFPELDLQTKHRSDSVGSYNYIRSTDDISSGYSSAEPGLSRTASVSSGSKVRLRSKNRSEVEEFQSSATQFSDKEVIYSRYDPNLQSYIYYSSSLMPDSVLMRSIEPTPTGSVELPSVLEEETEPKEDEKYKMFLKWLEEQKSLEIEPELPTSIEDEIFVPEPVTIETSEDIPEPIVNLDPIEIHEVEPPHEPSPESVDEFHDVVDDDDEEPSTVSEPTIKINPDYLILLEQVEKLAQNLPAVEDSKKPDIPKEILVGQTLIQLECPTSDHSSDEEIVIQSKLTISNSHVELQTMKHGSTGSQTSLNLLVPKSSNGSQLSLSSSQDVTSNVGGSSQGSLSSLYPKIESSVSGFEGSLQLPKSGAALKSLSLPASKDSERKPAVHSKGKAPPIPPKTPKVSPKSKKPRLLSSLTGIFKSDAQSTSKDGSTSEAPKETQI